MAPHLPYFLASFTWNYGLGMTWLAVPLYAYSKGLSGAETVAPEMRGSALALGGLGWGLSHLSTPLVMGLLADRYGVVAGFYVLGAMALATTLLIAFTRSSFQIRE